MENIPRTIIGRKRTISKQINPCFPSHREMINRLIQGDIISMETVADFARLEDAERTERIARGPNLVIMCIDEVGKYPYVVVYDRTGEYEPNEEIHPRKLLDILMLKGKVLVCNDKDLLERLLNPCTLDV